ncbi:MAG: hypothetical protein JXR52_10990 [Bacteroidales bacterium]|nr:hypothetical protein [Bacteroidales bacterium]
MKYLRTGGIIGLMLVNLLFFEWTVAAQENSLITPESFFGFKPGADRMLFDYEQMIEYLQKIDAVSPKLKMEMIGYSPEGRPIYIAFFSAEENISRLEELKTVNRELALNPDISEGVLESMVTEGKVFVLATLSMHSTEVGPSQSAPLIAYDLVTTNDPAKLRWLNDVVFMMVPCHNPDGMDMVVKNYNKYKGTRYEGASLPGVYHKYVGHDNNRDFVTLSQEDNKAIAAIYNLTWFPQVMVEKHQMGSTGARLFVPPTNDPIAENVDAGIFTWSGIFGQNMVNDLTRDNLAGVTQRYLFDDYWPGSTETCIWKNVIGFLTEMASVRDATPVYVEPTELSAGGKGLAEYKKSTNMLLPWEGGWWRLGDIVEYEIATTMSILKTASLHREEILRFRNALCVKEVNKGKTATPYYYIMPLEQHDQGELPGIVNLMKEHGVRCYELTGDILLEGRIFKAGDVVIPLAQPFRSFIKEVMEVQEFPERHYTPGGELIRPYDITSWSLPLHRQVKSYGIDVQSPELEAVLSEIEDEYSLTEPLKDEIYAVCFPVNYNESFRAAFNAAGKGIKVERLTKSMEVGGKPVGAGSFITFYDPADKESWNAVMEEISFRAIPVTDKSDMQSEPLVMPRIALVETWFHDMDAGWTRFLFDRFHIPYTVLRPGDFKETDLAADFDVVVFPDNDKNVLMTGKRKSGDDYSMSSYHPDYVKGMEKEGLENLMTFVDKGGIIIAWGRSANLFEGILKIKKSKDEEEEFELPFSDISENLRNDGLYIPGSLMKLNILQDHPLTLGMPEQIGIFSRGRPVFRTGIPMFDTDRRVIGTYPEKDILLSGYAAGEEKVGNKAAMIWMRKGKGQFVLYGFNPQFRASTQSSFKLLFNALLLEQL